jgi:hypothetical protein
VGIADRLSNGCAELWKKKIRACKSFEAGKEANPARANQCHHSRALITRTSKVMLAASFDRSGMT